MTFMNAVDTNILLYASDPRDQVKQIKATQLIDELNDGVLLWQVACEYLAAARKLAAFGFSEQAALYELTQLRAAWRLVLPTWAVFDSAADLRSRYSLSIWDSLIAAQRLAADVSVLYTEDFGAAPNIDGLQVVNPFTL